MFLSNGGDINMNSATIMVLVIISIVALIMMLIGIKQFNQKEDPVGFYNLIDPPKAVDITDIVAWNRKHGLIWIIYGMCIEAGFWIGYFIPNEVLQTICMMGGGGIPLPFMVIRHKVLVRKYHK